MNQEMHSSQSELLHAYLDGEISSTEEHVLFSQLAENEELRGEMRELLAIRNAIHNDKEALIPPLAATTAIFTGLGFSAPSAASAMAPAPVPVPTSAPPAPPLIDPGTSGVASSVFGSVARPLVKPLVGAVVGSALTATVVTTVVNDQQSQDLQQVQQSEHVQLIQEVPQTPMLGDLWIDVSEPPVDAGTHSTAGIVKDERTNDRFSGSDIDILPLETSGATSDKDLLVRAKEVERLISARFGDLTPKQDHVIVQIANTPVSMSNPSSSYITNGNQNLINMRGGLFYVVDNHSSFGMEVGRETFPQVFHSTEPDGIANHEQNPTAMWVTAVYRYKTGEISLVPGVRGFVQANLGGALGLGPLGRGVAGIEYALTPGLIFQVGIEGSMLIYKLENTVYTTDKLGLNYGLSLQF